MLIRIVLQARMGSKRRPGKTLADVAGRPLLARCLERLAAVVEYGGPAWQMIVATSTNPGDDDVARLAESSGYRCVRGSEGNVLSRFVQATDDLADDDLVIRATADNPLYDAGLTQQLVADHLRGGNLYTGIDPLSPSVPEVLYVGTLRQAASSAALTEYDREHVTPFFRRDDSPRGCVRLPPTWRGLDPTLRLTVDTPDDMAFMNGLYRTLIDLTGNDRPEAWSLEQVYEVARALTSSANRFAAETSVVNNSGATT